MLKKILGGPSLLSNNIEDSSGHGSKHRNLLPQILLNHTGMMMYDRYLWHKCGLNAGFVHFRLHFPLATLEPKPKTLI